jgi:hypothetical protein
MKLFTILAIALLGVGTNADNSTSLLYALRSANAAQFADFLEANPDILATYNSTSVQTIFAPSDSFFTTPLRRRQAAASSQQQAALQYSHRLNNLEALGPSGSVPGAVVQTGLQAPLAGGSQSIVSQKVVANSTTRRRRTVPSTGIELLSGLGHSVNILNGDIPYDNGVIHVTDGYVKLPSTTSSHTDKP